LVIDPFSSIVRMRSKGRLGELSQISERRAQSRANARSKMIALRARNRALSFELGRLSESPSNLIHLGRRPDSREYANAAVAVPPALMLS
jgi:hypothetical protein